MSTPYPAGTPGTCCASRSTFNKATEEAGWSGLHPLVCHQHMSATPKRRVKWLFLCVCIRVPLRMNYCLSQGCQLSLSPALKLPFSGQPKCESRKSKAEVQGCHSVTHRRFSSGLEVVWSTEISTANTSVHISGYYPRSTSCGEHWRLKSPG